MLSFEELIILSIAKNGGTADSLSKDAERLTNSPKYSSGLFKKYLYDLKFSGLVDYKDGYYITSHEGIQEFKVNLDKYNKLLGDLYLNS